MLIPNHGLGYLATALKKDGLEVNIIDCIRDHTSARALRSHIEKESYDVVGFQIYTFDLEIMVGYLNELEEFTGIVVAGGPHPSADPSGTLQKFPRIDVLFVGEAEISLCKFLDVVQNNKNWRDLNLTSIPGLNIRRGDTIESSPPKFEQNLDLLGFPDWEQISPPSYPIAPQGTFTRRIPYAPIIITRGCPYPCTFCAGKIISGCRIRRRSVPHVISELKFLIKKYRIKEFHIQDDNFTQDKEYVMLFCRTILENNLDLTWACPNGIRLDSLDVEMLQAMERAGCYSVAVGIESGSQRVLDLMKKKVSLADLKTKVNLIRNVTKWHITGFFILGYPGETKEEIKATIQLSRRLPLDKANFGILMPLPGTEASLAAEAAGWNPHIDLEKMSEYRSPFTPPGLSSKQFRFLFQMAFISFYARPRIIWRFLKQIKSIDQFKILIRRFRDVISS